MSKMIQVICNNKKCKSPFMARVADVERGWGKFCSKSCKAVSQEDRTHQCSKYYSRSNHPDDIDCGHFMQSGIFGHGQE